MVVDGLGFEEVNQAVTSTAVISGTNVYGAVSVQTPTLVSSTTLSGVLAQIGTISGTSIRANTVIANTTLSGGKVAVTSIVGTVISGTEVRCDNVIANGSGLFTGNVESNSKILSPAAIGTTWGKFIQAGSANASNVAVNVVFGTPFAGVAHVVLGVLESGAAATQPGCVVDVNAGSFQFLGTSGLDYSYVAVG